MGQRTRAWRETSAGGVVFRCTPDGPRYLLILDTYRNWGFPKGHVDDREATDEAARREIAEETGLRDLQLHGRLGVIDWHFRLRGRLIHKYCHFYLFESPRGEPQPQAAEGISRCAWQPLDRALDAISYESSRAILRQASETVEALCRERRVAGRR